MCDGDGSESPAELAARLGPRYDLDIELRDRDVIFLFVLSHLNTLTLKEGCGHSSLGVSLTQQATISAG